jgi:RNA polymerase sigma-70 factor, ECF subfamily
VPRMDEPLNRREITTLLIDWRRGDSQASEQLLSLVYQELRRIAARHLRMERPGHILQPTALVHELYLRLFAGEPVDYVDRTHFFAAAARQLRRILIDHARSVHTEKRGHGHIAVSLTDIDAPAQAISEDLIAVNQALDELDKLDSRCAQVVELRFFAGLTEEEASQVLKISKATVKRDWDFARAWLHSRLVKP